MLSILSINELTMTMRTHAKATMAVLTTAEGGGVCPSVFTVAMLTSSHQH